MNSFKHAKLTERSLLGDRYIPEFTSFRDAGSFFGADYDECDLVIFCSYVLANVMNHVFELCLC